MNLFDILKKNSICQIENMNITLNTPTGPITITFKKQTESSL